MNAPLVKTGLSISAVFPAFNDAGALPALLRDAFEVLGKCAADFDVTVVNDGSSDDTAQVLEQLQAHYGSRLRVITHERNQGYGAALRTGFRAATRDFVFYTDGDGQYDVRDLERLVAEVRPGVGLVNGYKTNRADALHRRLVGAVYNRVVRALFRLPVRDTDCDFRLMRRSVLEQAHLASRSGAFCVDLMRQFAESGCGIVEVPVRHLPRQHGNSQFFRIRPLCTTAAELARLYRDRVLRKGVASQ